VGVGSDVGSRQAWLVDWWLASQLKGRAGGQAPRQAWRSCRRGGRSEDQVARRGLPPVALCPVRSLDLNKNEPERNLRAESNTRPAVCQPTRDVELVGRQRAEEDIPGERGQEKRDEGQQLDSLFELSPSLRVGRRARDRLEVLEKGDGVGLLSRHGWQRTSIGDGERGGRDRAASVVGVGGEADSPNGGAHSRARARLARAPCRPQVEQGGRGGQRRACKLSRRDRSSALTVCSRRKRFH